MKKAILVSLFYIISTITSGQQYKVDKRLIGQLMEVYVQTNKKENFFTRLSTSTVAVFSSGNKLFMNAIQSITERNKISIDSAANIVFDTLMSSFSRDHIWDEYPGKEKEYVGFLNSYYQLICPCITDKINTSPNKKLKDGDMEKCVTNLASDTSYVNTVKRQFSNKPLDEIMQVGEIASLFVFRNCKPVNLYFTGILRGESVYSFLSKWDNELYDIDNKIVQKYSSKAKDLPALLPAYKKSEPSIKSLSTTLSIKKIDSFKEKETNSAGDIIITKTYYSFKNDSGLIYGQLVVQFKKQAINPIITSFRYIPFKQMKDGSKFLEKLNDKNLQPPSFMEPPPDVEILQEVKIDTLKKRN
jgi:hypothetical protein